jgi:anti-sigma regulatory factor (Ser/Thr protein kinase)
MICLPVTELSHIAQARRTATKLAGNLGLSETDVGKVALIITELGMNLVKHAAQGQLLIRGLSQNDTNGIELLALDKGPGMTNVAACLRDGYSTAGSLGTGLGAIVRTASFSEIYSIPLSGTVVLAQIFGNREAVPGDRQNRGTVGTPANQPLTVSGVSIPKSGETACGDAWGLHQRPERSVLMVVDGLGHGPLAADAAQEALRVFHSRTMFPPAQMIEALHHGLRATRGAAVAVAEINHAQQQIQYCGVGNIAGTILTAPGRRSLVSHNGIVGHELRRIQEFTYHWPEDALLVMHSDGLMSRWDLSAYPGLLTRHLSVISAVLYRDFSRGRDDVTVVVAKGSSA